MKLTRTKLGFTLIELLVVITIIGILATGATGVYTSQIQKARDSTRINDVKVLQSGVEQAYQDKGEYPAKGNTFSGITIYVPKMPQDPKTAQDGAGTVFDYLYNVSADSNTIIRQEYELSTAFEQEGNRTEKAEKDGGNDTKRFELGIGIEKTNKDTIVNSKIGKTATKYKCIKANGDDDGDCTDDGDPMLIRN